MSYLDKLNLRPFEKRLVVVVAAMLFLVLNWVFVWPHFSDWDQVKFRMAKSKDKLNMYIAATNQIPTYHGLIDQIQNQENSSVPAEEQVLQFARTILDHQVRSGITINQAGTPVARTNNFFVEQTETISVMGKEEQLVDFLYGLGSGGGMIRVRGLTLKPDLPRHQLSATIQLVASYQKKVPAKPAPGSSGRVAASVSAGSASAGTPSEAAPAQPDTKAKKAPAGG